MRLHPIGAVNGNKNVKADTMLAIALNLKHCQGKRDMDNNTRSMFKALLLMLALAAPVSVQAITDGMPMYAGKNIIDDTVTFKEHTVLVAAVKAAGLMDSLK